MGEFKRCGGSHRPKTVRESELLYQTEGFFFFVFFVFFLQGMGCTQIDLGRARVGTCNAQLFIAR